jgi:hypothetical protein
MKLVLHLLCFNKTFSRLVGLSVDEIAALLEEDRLGQGAKDVVLFPPGDDDNTDVDSEDEETSNLNSTTLGQGCSHSNHRWTSPMKTCQISQR